MSTLQDIPKTQCQPVVSIGLRRIVVCVLGVLGMLLLSSGSADASCGNYLYRNGQRVDSSMSTFHGAGHSMSNQSSDQGPPASGQIPAGEMSGHGRSNGPQPCRGPNCSKNPSPLAPVPAAPVNLTRTTDQLAVLDSSDRGQSTGMGSLRPQSDRGQHFLPQDVFRPPA